MQVEHLSSNLVTFSSLEELRWVRQQLVVARSKWEEMVWVGASDLKGPPINDFSDNAALEYFRSNFLSLTLSSEFGLAFVIIFFLVLSVPNS